MKSDIMTLFTNINLKSIKETKECYAESEKQTGEANWYDVQFREQSKD